MPTPGHPVVDSIMRIRNLLVFRWLVAVLLGACLPTGSGGDGGTANFPSSGGPGFEGGRLDSPGFEAFVGRYERAYCDMLASCPHASDDGFPTFMYTIGQATCVERTRASFSARYRKLLAQGLVAFDQEAADRCIHDLEDSCIAMSAYVCRDVLVGLTEKGGACHDDAMCAGGDCDGVYEACAIGTCDELEELPPGPVVYTISGPGEVCQHHNAYQGCARGLACAYEDEVCLEPRKLGEACSSYDPCTAGTAMCIRDDGDSFGSTCRPLLLRGPGEACDSEPGPEPGPLQLCDRFRNLECVQGLCAENGLGVLGAECSRYPPELCKPGLECQRGEDASGFEVNICGQPVECPSP